MNDYKPHYVVEQVEQAAAGLVNPKIACLGLAFKPDIDDLRESPALDITKTLANNPAYQILAVEPNIEVLPAALENRNNVKLTSLSDAIQKADIVVILVKHNSFTSLSKRDFKEAKVYDFVNATY
ncbi:UDP-glucose 6-dehydrogenase YwqF [compost metagenome]